MFWLPENDVGREETSLCPASILLVTFSVVPTKRVDPVASQGGGGSRGGRVDVVMPQRRLSEVRVVEGMSGERPFLCERRSTAGMFDQKGKFIQAQRASGDRSTHLVEKGPSVYRRSHYHHFS